MRPLIDQQRSATIVEYMRRNCGVTDCLAYYYFDLTKGSPGNVMSCLRSLIAQLVEGEPGIPGALQKLFIQDPADSFRLDRDTLIQVLISRIRKRRTTYIIVDAVDEAAEQEDILDLLAAIGESQLDSLHLLVSSRFDIKIKECLDPIATAVIGIGDHGVNHDISLHVLRYLQANCKMRKWDGSMKREVEASVIAAPGRYVVCL